MRDRFYGCTIEFVSANLFPNQLLSDRNNRSLFSVKMENKKFRTIDIDILISCYLKQNMWSFMQTKIWNSVLCWSVSRSRWIISRYTDRPGKPDESYSFIVMRWNRNRKGKICQRKRTLCTVNKKSTKKKGLPHHLFSHFLLSEEIFVEEIKLIWPLFAKVNLISLNM